jgi:hypothetical protein
MERAHLGVTPDPVQPRRALALDAVLLVHVVQGSALAQGPAQQTADIPAGAVRMPPEEPGLGVGGQRGESKQVCCFDPRQRPVHIRRHATIVSRQLLDPSDTGEGAAVRRARCL